MDVSKETVSSLEKKQKTNVDENCSDIEALFSDEEYDSEDDYDPDLMKKYCQQIKKSQGFDVEDYPGQCWMTTAFPMPNYLNNPENVDKLKGYAGQALKKYNDREGTSYEVNDILKVNGGGCRDFVYYITLSVKNGVHPFFHVKVVEDFNFHLEFPIVEPTVEAVVE